MILNKSTWVALGPTALFVLLWSSGAIFSSWGLQHASAFAFLFLRFLLACVVLGLLASYRLATVLGVQPILTLLLVERRVSWLRLSGLLLALGGLALVVLESLLAARFSLLGISLTLAALGCITLGSIFQKGLQQAPMDVLPLQYLIGLLLCMVFVPFQPFEYELTVGFIVPLIYMGVVISVLATLLLYRLIRVGNLVNVTSLFYLVTAGLDYLFLGNRMAPLSLLGMLAILAGLALVFRQAGSSAKLKG